MNDYTALIEKYKAFQARNLILDLSRGKPETRQLDLSNPMLAISDFTCEDGMDARNYGDPTGIPEAKRLFGALLGVNDAQVLVGGNSSINLIYDALTRALLHGPLEGDTPWRDCGRVKFICPVPGYDWHFHMLNLLGIECLPVPIHAGGPDMDRVEALAKQPGVKGMLCVPMYSNPTGITFSDAAVDRLAKMETAEPDFRIFWDNAYCVHHLYPENRDHLKSLLEACRAAGTENRALLFTSTSKITFAGGGVSAMAASPANIARQSALMLYQMVCYDKVNQLRHARFLPNMNAVEAHMQKHAELLRPKFELVCDTLERELSGIGTFTRPRGGYFVCYRAPHGCAKRIVRLCREAGVTLTPAGAPFPGGQDPEDSVIRLAPSYPPLEQLSLVMELFPIAVRLAVEERNKGRG